MPRLLPLLMLCALTLFSSPALGVEREIEEPTIERASQFKDDIRPVGEPHAREQQEKRQNVPKEERIQTQDIRKMQENFQNREEELFRKYEKKFEALRMEFSPETQWGASEEEWQRTWEKLSPEQQAQIQEVERAFRAEQELLAADRQRTFQETERRFVEQTDPANWPRGEIGEIESELARQLRQSPEEIRAGELREYEQQLARYRAELEVREREVRTQVGGAEADRIIEQMRSRFAQEADRHRQEIEQRHEMRLHDPGVMQWEQMPHRRMEMESRPYSEFDQLDEFEQIKARPPESADEIREMIQFMDDFYNDFVEARNRELLQTTDPFARQMIEKELEMGRDSYLREKENLEKLLRTTN